jgi:hypothetical protein
VTIHIDLDPPVSDRATLTYDLDGGKPGELADRIAADLDLEPGDVAEVIDLDGQPASVEAITAAVEGGKRLRIHLVCIELHYESEIATHLFPARARWASVHRWGCRHFHVAHDACAQLELRVGAANGLLLNERESIGTFEGCKEVWLVKPGAEPNGRRA